MICIVLSMLLVTTYASFDDEKPLFLSKHLKVGDVIKARELSTVRPSWMYEGTSHAGYLTANDTLGNHLFFWYLPSPTNRSAPLLVWLNGGPGISSLVGMFFENGPPMEKTSWVGPFSMLYIDNPVGTGFSFSESGESGLRRDKDGYGSDLYNVLLQFCQIFPQRDVYIGGQSYGAKYALALASRVHRERATHTIPIKGVYIGGGYFAPNEMSSETPNFLYNLGFISKSMVDSYENNSLSVFKDLDYENVIKKIFGNMYFLYCFPVDVYNFALGKNGRYEKHYNNLSSILNNQNVKDVLNVGNQLNYSATSDNIQLSLMNDSPSDMKEELAVVLDNYKTLVYNGEYDVIVNTPGTEAALLATAWVGQADYAAAQRYKWLGEVRGDERGDVRGFFTHVGNLCRVVVRGAGHWTPRDAPEASLEMMTSFTSHGCVTGEPIFKDFHF